MLAARSASGRLPKSGLTIVSTLVQQEARSDKAKQLSNMNVDQRLIGDYRDLNFKKKFPVTIMVIWGSAISFLWIFFYKFWFVNINALFPGASVLGEIFYTISLSIISSTIFYFIVVYFPEKRKKTVVSRAVNRAIGKLNLDYLLIKQDLYKLKNLSPPLNLPRDFNEIIRLCEGVLLTDTPPHIGNNPEYYPSNWYEYFDYYFTLEKSNIEHLNRYWEVIPYEVKASIDELESNTLKSGLDTFRNTGVSNKLSDLAGPIWSHLNLLTRIVTTFEKEW